MTFDESVEALNTRLGGMLYFVEIGAMDGVSYDALHPHIVKNPNWQGVLVEPLPDMFEKLQRTYAGRSNLSFENSAITSSNGTADITRIPPEKVNRECPPWSDGISTLRPDIHIIGQYGDLVPHTVNQTIQTIDFLTLIDRHNVHSIDLLQVDAEGYDKDIFDQVSRAGYNPYLIKLEVNYMMHTTIRDLKFSLEERGYTCFLEGDDMVAAR